MAGRRVVSNSGMQDPNPTDARLTDLEIKASFSEDLLEQLNQVVIRQQAQIDLLVQQVSELRRQLQDSASGEFRSVANERPPHY